MWILGAVLSGNGQISGCSYNGARFVFRTGVRQLVSSIPVTHGLGTKLAGFALTLIFAIFAHVVTCPPCYDDDICASARIDAAHCSTVVHHTIVEVSRGKDIVPLPLLGASGSKRYAGTAPELHLILFEIFSGPSEGRRDFAALAHPRTDVLLI